MSAAAPRSGGRILVDQLRLHRADAAFCVPGESFLEVLDALHDAPELRLVVCRQEGGAAAMAGAYGRVTGRPGVCLVSRAPGATNASSGVHMAYQDSAPLLLVVGLAPRAVAGREAFQELAVEPFFGQMAKWAARVDDRPATVLRVDHAQLGIVLPAGPHHVALRYRARGLLAGTWLAAAAAVGLALRARLP